MENKNANGSCNNRHKPTNVGDYKNKQYISF